MNMTTAENILSEIIDELRPLPHAQRAALARVYRQALDEHDALRLNHAWELHARPDQLPPPGNWNTWLILAGRGFGKTPDLGPSQSPDRVDALVHAVTEMKMWRTCTLRHSTTAVDTKIWVGGFWRKYQGSGTKTNS